MKLIIDIPEKIEEYIKDYIPIGAGNNVFCYPDEIVRVIQNGTPIPDNATNGELKGVWIHEIEDWNKWTCSKCGYVKRTDIHVTLGWKYCPNCGSNNEVRKVNNSDIF